MPKSKHQVPGRVPSVYEFIKTHRHEKGDCSLKKEQTKKQIYKNREFAIADRGRLLRYLLQSTRRHSHLGGLSPEQFEVAHEPRRERLH